MSKRQRRGNAFDAIIEKCTGTVSVNACRITTVLGTESAGNAIQEGTTKHVEKLAWLQIVQSDWKG